MYSIQEYLAISRGYLDDILCHPGVHIVIGNETCDIDSMVSCMALAYLYHLTKYKSGQVKVIPVMNVTSSEFQIRTLNLYLLTKYNIPIKCLVFRDDINFEELVANKGLKVSLVDHHVLAKSLSFLKPFVIDIHDHRPIDESEEWGGNVEKTIQEVGSCATLVAQKFLTTLNKCSCLGKRDVFYLLIETIVFDTVGLNPEVKRVTPTDLQVCKQIEETLGETAPIQFIYEHLWEAHRDISTLTTSQLLIKDLKLVADVYVPGLPMLVENFLKRGDVKPALLDFYKQKNATAVVLMGIETSDGEVRRDIALYAPEKDNELIGVIRNRLLESDFGVEEVQCNVPQVIYFKQNNVGCSRKQLIPIIRECIVVK